MVSGRAVTAHPGTPRRRAGSVRRHDPRAAVHPPAAAARGGGAHPRHLLALRLPRRWPLEREGALHRTDRELAEGKERNALDYGKEMKKS